MRMPSQFKLNNRIKKSHTLMLGSFLIFVGFFSLFSNYFAKMREEVYSEMKIAMMDYPVDEINVSSNDQVVENIISSDTPHENNKTYVIDYSKYLGVLEIPKIGLKRGFYNFGSRYNNVQYNVTMVEGSTMPDYTNGNLILMAHSGDAYISFFAYLWKLNVGDTAYVSYLGKKYQFQITDIYDVPKIGVVKIRRNMDRTCLTLITCTKNNDTAQTIYVAELVN